MAKPPINTPDKPPPKRFCGVKGRSGPRPGSQNAMRHGLRAGALPKDAKYIENRLNAFRRTLEQAVLIARGEVNIPDAAYIQTCLRWERHACLAQRWLNKAGDTLKPADKLTFSREIARASSERDKAITALKIDKEIRLPWLVPPAQIECANREENNHDRQ